MSKSHRYFGICNILHISAISQSANNHFLKIQVTRTPFKYGVLKPIIEDDSASRFSNIENVYTENQQIMQKW